MTYRDPDSPLPADAPTESYRTDGETPPPTEPAPAPSGTAWPSQGSPLASTEPVQTRGPRRGLRWAVAVIVTALVVSTVAAAAFIMSGKAPAATVLGWVPADSVMYAEARLDLPGDQRAKLGEFLSKFPGFRDQAALQTKVLEALDQLVSGTTNGEQTYSGDIEPWFGGEIVMSTSGIPGAALSDPGAMPETPDAVVLISIKDATKAKAWLNDAAKDLEPTSQDYAGTQLTLFAPHDEQGADDSVAYALPTDEVLIVGPVDSVKSAIDTKGEGGLAADEAFTAALASSSKDHVGFMFVNMREYMKMALSLPGATGIEGCGTAGLTANALDTVPGWIGMHLRIEGDGLVMDATAPVPAAPATDLPTNRTSTLAGRLPASTIAMFEGHDLGKTLLDAIEVFRADPACADVFQQVDQVVGMLGGLEKLLGWMGDAAIVLNRTADGVEGGLVFQAANAEDASNLFLTLRSFVALGGSQAGVSLREETHGDATISILDVGDAETLFGMAGAGAGMPVEPPGGPGSRVELAWTVTDDLVVMSVGTNFVKHVLDTDQANSLASSARFSALLERTGSKENVGVSYADLTAMRELAEGALRSEPQFAQYLEEVQPFLLPFDAYMTATNVSSDASRVTSIITIK